MSAAHLGNCVSASGRAIVAMVCVMLSYSTSFIAAFAGDLLRDDHGAIVRGDADSKKLALVFTGDEHAESTAPILDALKERRLRASFFVTGNFLRQPALSELLERMTAEGHYLGPHSDSHSLYCAWDDREKNLVTQEFFTADLRKNVGDLRAIGALKRGPVFFVPPYEWHNRQHVDWCRDFGVTLINFPPGTGSNRDYAPEGHPRFVPSEVLLRDILEYEQKNPHGLNGFIVLMHLGSGRKDPLHPLLGRLCDRLIERGYKFERVDELLADE